MFSTYLTSPQIWIITHTCDYVHWFQFISPSGMRLRCVCVCALFACACVCVHAFVTYWTVCISVALDGLYLSDIGQPVYWWHRTACISVELNSLWLSAKSLRDLMVLSTGCYTCTGGNSKGCAAVWQNWWCMWYRHPVSVPQQVMLASEVALENYVQLEWGAACSRQALSRSNEAILITQQKSDRWQW